MKMESKKEYVTPMAVEEAFVANEYVAKCGTQVTGKNGMRCINPYHNHYAAGYFTYVWIEGSGVVCDTIVTKATPKSNGNGQTSTERNGWCLFANGRSEQATQIKRIGGTTYYVPASIGTNGDCYGQYRFEGSYIDQVLS